MKMKRWLRNRKAVSPVIAALLLIAISVAAAVITYSWVMTMIEGQGSQAQTTIRFEEVVFDVANSENQIKFVVRNSGGVTAVIQTVYIYQGDTRIVKQDDVDHPISAGETAEMGLSDDAEEWETGNLAEPVNDVVVAVTWNDNFALSTAYSVKVVTDNGFTIEGTYYSPSAW